MRLFGGEVAAPVEPCLTIYAGDIDYQRVTIPSGDRIAHEGWVGIVVFAAERNAPPGMEGFEDDHHFFRRLYDLKRHRHAVNARNARKQTLQRGIVEHG